MYKLVETESFSQWLSGLKDRNTRARLLLRLSKVSLGNLGDHRAVGHDVWEMREFFGPGWRMYYIQHEGAVIMMLGGGNKSSQKKDIERTKTLAREIRNEPDPSI